MLPRWHILWGAVFTLIIWLFSRSTSPIYLLIIFLSSVLIDFDHYINSVVKTKDFSLSKSIKHHSKNQKTVKNLKKFSKKDRGSEFFIFHSLEAHILAAILGLIWTPFFFVFIGMMFHSILDLIWLLDKGQIQRRQYSLIRKLFSK